MSEHICSLPRKELSGLPPLPPNATFYMRLRRTLRKLTLLNPETSRCKNFFHHKSAVIAEQKKHAKGSFRYIIHPFSTFNSAFELIFFTLWITKMAVCPMTSNILQKNSFLVYIFDRVLGNLQILLIICYFSIGYIPENGNEVVLHPLRIAKQYLLSYFVFDLGTLHVWNNFADIILDRVDIDVSLRWRLRFGIQFLDAVCLYVRLPSILGYVDHTGELLRLPLRVRKCVTYLLRTFLLIHFFSCVLYFVPQLLYYTDWPEGSWLVEAKIAPPFKPTVTTIYRECLLTAICYFFGTSPGMYRISETNEQICLSFITLFGRLYTLFLLADVLRFFGIVGLSEANYEKQILRLREYMIVNNVPRNMRGRMLRYYQNRQQRRHFNDREILGSLSGRLQKELFLFSARMLMQKSHVFKNMPQEEIADFISKMKQETYATGDLIFSSGQAVDVIYFISFGTVALLTKEGREVCHLEDGEVFGLCNSTLQRRKFSALVLETAELFYIRKRELDQFLTAYPAASEYIQHLAAQRFIDYMELERAFDAKSCLEELRRGTLLEQRRRRKLVGA